MAKFLLLIPILLSLFFLHHSQAIIFNIQNNCSYTVWPAAVPGGGSRLDSGETWTISLPNGPKIAKIWGRTNCTFNAAGQGSCQTGDCGGNQVQCPPHSFGSPPYTLVEYGLNTFGHKDYYFVSLIHGFNIPVEVTPTTNGCTRSVRCGSEANIVGQCPQQLRAGGGCNNPCTVFKTAQYCCGSGACQPTDLSKYFKDKCPDTFTFPEDDPTSTFTCPPATNYRVVFCPN